MLLPSIFPIHGEVFCDLCKRYHNTCFKIYIVKNFKPPLEKCLICENCIKKRSFYYLDENNKITLNIISSDFSSTLYEKLNKEK
jgi:hypothetical protein